MKNMICKIYKTRTGYAGEIKLLRGSFLAPLYLGTYRANTIEKIKETFANKEDVIFVMKGELK